ncbi:MAG: hypothetical protein OJJ54_00010 [Pseudonocardia sp.]|nr:hypothetical protein [Pseudonocardia sp.]
MFESTPDHESASGASSDQDPAQKDLENTVDEMEERVLGHTVDQVRDEDEAESPADEQDLDPDEGSDGPDRGPGAEPA